MKVNKIERSLVALTVLVLISLGAGQKSAEANTISNNTNHLSLADIKLEKEIEANKSWNNYIETRKELMYYEKTFPQLLEYNLPGSNSELGSNSSSAKYRLKMDNVMSKNDEIIANQILNLLNDAWYQYTRALELQQEVDSYEDRAKTFS